jgi:predicted MFS family arabinose efflux permease
MLLVLRAVAGIGGGLLSAVSTAAMARAASPERAFAASAVAQALLAAACTLATPSLLAAGSWGAVYLLLGVLGVPGLFLGRPIATFTDRRDAATAEARSARSPLSLQLVLGPAGVLLSYVAMSMVWTYYGQIGESGHLSTSSVARALSLGAIAGLFVSIAVTALGSVVPRGLALLMSLLLTCGGVTLAFGSTGAWMFSLSVVVWACGAGLFTPYAFAASAAADSTGSSTALASALSGAGIALGPLVAAPFIAAQGLGSVRWLAPAFLAAGFVALAALLYRIRGRVPALA